MFKLSSVLDFDVFSSYSSSSSVIPIALSSARRASSMLLLSFCDSFDATLFLRSAIIKSLSSFFTSSTMRSQVSLTFS